MSKLSIISRLLCLPAWLGASACMNPEIVTTYSRPTQTVPAEVILPDTTTGLPKDAILPFDAAVCPTGWTDFSEANGRVLVGAGSVLGLTARARGDLGGREFTTGIPA